MNRRRRNWNKMRSCSFHLHKLSPLDLNLSVNPPLPRIKTISLVESPSIPQFRRPSSLLQPPQNLPLPPPPKLLVPKHLHRKHRNELELRMVNKVKRSALPSEETNDERSRPNLNRKQKEEKGKRRKRKRRKSDQIKTRRSSYLPVHSQEWRRTNLPAQLEELANRRLNQR